MSERVWLVAGWSIAIGAAVGVRLWNALGGALMWGYDAWGHVAYVLFLDLYRAVPYADQGWSYYQPPLHYVLGWGLAQLGSAEALVRGLSLLSGAASLGIASLSAWLAGVAFPGRPALALLAFCAVAYLPVHFTVGNMPGNEMTVALLGSAALCSFIANERRARPLLRWDALTGLLLALAVLAKHSGFMALATIGAALPLRVVLAPERGAELQRAVARAAVLAAALLAVAGPHYLRNVQSYGKLIPTNRDYPLVAEVEAGQPPGVRRVRDFLTISPAVFTRPNPLAPHMLHSVWGSLYVNLWADTHRESDRERALEAERRIHPRLVWMPLLGLLPTLLALAGSVLALGDVLQGRRRAITIPLLLAPVFMLLAFSSFVWIVPRWAAVKASYCLFLSIPFAFFLTRGVDELGRRAPRGVSAAVAAGLAVVALVSAVVASSGAVAPRRRDAPASAAVRFYFGEYEAAGRTYGQLVGETGYKVPWLENLAAVELATGQPERARRLTARAVALAAESGRSDPRRRGRLAVAEALAGERAAARASFDAALAAERLPELLANRGALRAAEGDAAGAVADLRAALALDPELVPAWLDLVAALAASGRDAEAREAAARAAAQACRAPRGYPHGVGTGEALEWGVGRRGLLLVEGDTLRLAGPEFYRSVCRELASGS